jgi:RNA 3'-terminal phosphate cyclase (ATP)
VESHVVETTRDSTGPGNVAMVEIKSAKPGGSEVTEIFTAFGQLGVSAEKVGSEVAREGREYLVSKAAVGEHLTDQLLLPMALAGAGSFTALKLNPHANTNMEVIAKFLPVRFNTRESEGFTTVEVKT